MSVGAGHPGISQTLQFRVRIDGVPIEFHNTANTGWHLFIRSSALFLEGSTNTMSLALGMEDTASITDGTWHSLAITTTNAGPEVLLDGRQYFSTTADLSPATNGPEATPELTPGAGINIQSSTEHDGVLSPAEILVLSPASTPFTEFATARLSDCDVAELSELAVDTIFVRYHMRGPGQHDTILTASDDDAEQLSLSVTEEDIEYKILGRRNE